MSPSVGLSHTAKCLSRTERAFLVDLYEKITVIGKSAIVFLGTELKQES